ncbi:MAG: tetratricopeptide repeat protein [Spirochaetota bacterium]|nr:tetratricopeptide repeat protein [Spirochaetota bacterium]
MTCFIKKNMLIRIEIVVVFFLVILSLAHPGSLAADINTANKLVNQGNEKLQSGKYPEAIKYYTEAIKLKKDFIQAYLNRGIANMKSGKSAAALKDYSKVIQLDPKHSVAYFNRAIAYFNLKRYDMASRDFGKTIALNKMSGNKSYLSSLYQNRGLCYYYLMIYEKGIEDFSMSIRLTPKASRPYIYRGILYGRLNRFAEAIKDYETGIKLDPSQAMNLFNLGILYSHQKNYRKAISVFSQYISRKPKDSKGYLNRGLSFHAINDYKNAELDYLKALELNPRDAMTNYFLADVYLRMKRFEQSVIYSDKGLIIDPTSSLLHNKRGEAHKARKLTDKAIKDFTNAIKYNPRNPLFYYNMASAYSLKKNEKETLKWLQFALKKGFKEFRHLRSNPDFFWLKDKQQFKKLLEDYEKL